MRKVKLRMNEKEKYEVIKELVDHNGTNIIILNHIKKESTNNL